MKKEMSSKKRDSGGCQPTLIGLWHSRKNRDEELPTPTPAGGKRNREPASTPTPPSVAPPLRLGHGCGSSHRWENLSLPNGPMLLLRGSIGGKKESERRSTRKSLASMAGWNENDTFKIYGKECRMKRRIAQFSLDGKLSYSYSGLKNVVAPEFPPILRDIKDQVEDRLCEHVLELSKGGSSSSSKNLTISPAFVDLVQSITKNGNDGKDIYNYCLLNHYRDGEDNMGYHADNEASLDPHTPIASVSFGITRSFDVRPMKKDSIGKRSRVARIALGDGDLLIMLHPMQSHYQHSIPVEKRVVGERINLTFRRVLTL
mmetsp:Transcript_39705/g.83474  ORF Transcript_39705/g.83474 Transcript_39705/m.83474 type:complete len:316 (+) Transcript_39705:131-1078(+)